MDRNRFGSGGGGAAGGIISYAAGDPPDQVAFNAVVGAGYGGMAPMFAEGASVGTQVAVGAFSGAMVELTQESLRGADDFSPGGILGAAVGGGLVAGNQAVLGEVADPVAVAVATLPESVAVGLLGSTVGQEVESSITGSVEDPASSSWSPSDSDPGGGDISDPTGDE